jgi:hypothetical protein
LMAPATTFKGWGPSFRVEARSFLVTVHGFKGFPLKRDLDSLSVTSPQFAKKFW